MQLRKAVLSDLDTIIKKYENLIRIIKGDPDNDPDWNIGLYPTYNSLKGSILKEELFILEDKDILASCILNRDCVDSYNCVSFKTDLPAYFIHTFGVFSRDKGYGKIFLDLIKQYLVNQNIASIRLDVIEGNEKSRRFFVRNGFDDLGFYQLDYDETEAENFSLLEFDLTKWQPEI